MIPVDKALEIVLAHTRALPAEDVPLEAALGRVLAEDVASDVDLPPFRRAMMDGFALHARDVAAAPARLAVAGQVRAGQWPERALPPGQAVSIMTGAPLPEGADAVQQVEKTRTTDGGRAVEILEAVEAGANVAPVGCEVRAGQKVLEKGRVIDPATVAVLATVGRGRVRVGRRPRVAVVVTGDELVDVWRAPGRGQIRDGNGPALLAQARWAGAEARLLGPVPDEPQALAAAVRDGLTADVLVLSGGVSEGAFDLVEEVLVRFDVSLLFTKVAIKPGAPLVFGRRGDTLVFGLPGNPVSAQVTFDLFARAALLRQQGARVVSRPLGEAELLQPVRNRSGRRAHLPARARWEGGRLLAEPVPSRGSADLAAHAQANALVVLDAARTSAAAGERVPLLLLGNFLERDGR